MGELMCCYYPDNLVALYKCWKNSGLADTSYTTNAKRAILAVNLAHITNTPSILPSALYVCCQLDADVLLRGRVRRDGVVDTLSHEDLVRCIRGKAMLCTRSVQVCLDVFAPLKNPGCTSKDNRCKSSIMAGRLHSIRSCQRGNAEVLLQWPQIINNGKIASYRGRQIPSASRVLTSFSKGIFASARVFGLSSQRFWA